MIHYFADNGFLSGEKHILYCYNADKHALCVGNIAGIYGLLFKAGTPDSLKGVLRRKGSLQFHILRGHYGSRGVLGIMEYLVYLTPFLGIGVGQYAFYHVGGHFLDYIHRIVKEKVVHDVFKLSVGEGFYKRLLKVRVHFHKDIRCKILVQKSEHQRQLVLGKLLEKLCYIGRLLRAQKFSQLRVLFFVKQPSYFCYHRKHSFLSAVSELQASCCRQRYQSGQAAIAAPLIASRASFMEGAP